MKKNMKYNKEKESVAHFVTVIGCHAKENWDGGNFSTEGYEKAIQYTLEFIKYRFDPKNIK